MKNHLSSTEFSALCQSQISLLSQGLGAVWSAIYLTDNTSENGEAQLCPFAINPQQENQSFRELPPIELSEIWRSSQSNFIAQLLPNHLSNQVVTNTANEWQPQTTESKQLILPLVHQETFIGLLVTGREDREWHSDELQQIEEIARTIAIARFIEIQYRWTQDELAIQRDLRRIEHDRLDNLLHQLRNPLTALRTFGKLLLKRVLPSDPNHKIIQNTLAQSDRFQELLEQFETESKRLLEADSTDKSLPLLESDRRDIDRSSFLLPDSITDLDLVDLTPILDSLLNTTLAIAAERDIELIDNLPAVISPVKGNLEAIREILNNLIDNALKYTPRGGKIELGITDKQPNFLGLAIKDTGFGIPAEDRERIFERHYRGVQAQGDIPGTGLGLAIAQELALKMGGEIELISPNEIGSKEAGTTFIVWLRLDGQARGN